VTFPRLGQVSYLRRQMAQTLAGMKTGLFTHVDPGFWHPGYALKRPEASPCVLHKRNEARR
jgi:hypothetical protein